MGKAHEEESLRRRTAVFGLSAGDEAGFTAKDESVDANHRRLATKPTADPLKTRHPSLQMDTGKGNKRH